MKNISAVSDSKDIVTVEYLDDVTAVADKSSNFTINDTVHYPLLAVTAYGRSWQSEERIVNVADIGIDRYGLPVSSDGNYTDANGRQWICDKLIVNADGTGKIIKNIVNATLNGTGVNWIKQNNYFLGYADGFVPLVTSSACSTVGIVSWSNLDSGGYGLSVAYGIRLRFKDMNPESNTVEDLKSYLADNNITVIAKADTPTETELTAEQIAALQPVIDKYGAFTAYFMSTQDGTPTPENPVEIVSTADLHRVSVPIESIGDSGSLTVMTCGKNLIDIVLTSQTVNDVTITVNDDKSISFNGTASDRIFLYVSDYTALPKGTYIVSGCESVPKGFEFYAYTNNEYYLAPNGDRVFNIIEGKPVRLLLVIMKDTVVDNIIVHPMIRLASVADNTYEPHKSTTAKITTGLPLRGIPVSDGGNYTDSNGQEWVCDTIEYNYTSAVKKQRTAVIDSYNGETVGNNYISTTGGLDVGATVIYPAENAIETPLTAYEINQLRGLVTFDGTTNIYNSENAEMAVEYLTSKAVSKAVMPIITVLRGDSNA